ncbi:MAG: hypothetical protein AAF658_01720 [Myxococcota bacterium]
MRRMDADALLRLVVIVAVAVGGTGFLLGGFLTPVSGRWRDGQRTIELDQLGPWLTGRSERPGGHEIYKGFAVFGRVWLSRRNFGEQHLRELGFAESAIPVVDGAITARLRFRSSSGRLRGEFIGLRFDFSDPPVKILRAAQIAATERVWERA